MKIWEIIKEDFEPKEPLEEGWKENILATVISVAGLFGNLKAQNKLPNNTNITVSQQVSKDSIKLDFGKLFHSGKYIFTPDENETLKVELRKLGNEILKNPTSDFIVEIVSSESQVTNHDMEPSSPTYKKTLKVGELAKRRAETAKFILSNFTEQLKKDGVLKGEVKFVLPPKILVGDVPWPNVNPVTKAKMTNTDPQYTKDQFVYANIKIQNKTPKVDKYSAYAHIGQPIYFNQKLIGMAFVEARDSKNIEKSGNKNTAYQNLLFKLVKPDVQLTGEKDESGVYTKSYIIPWEWWNKNVFTHTLSKENLTYIVNNFEVQ